MKQKILESLLDIYLFPVKLNSRLKRFVREVTLIDEASHLSKSVQFLKSKQLTEKNPVVIDVGCANGDTTSFFLKELSHCRVFSFEANTGLAAKVQKRFSNEPVKVFALALSDKEGELTFHVTDNSLSSSYKSIVKNEQFQAVSSIKVPSKTLDSVMQTEKDVLIIDIIKLDVQGAETDVIQGATETLKKTKLLIVEQSVRSPYEGGSRYFEVDDLLRKNGFELLDIIITYRKDGLILTEFDSIYLNSRFKAGLF